jgi:hypothetical protein
MNYAIFSKKGEWMVSHDEKEIYVFTDEKYAQEKIDSLPSDFVNRYGLYIGIVNLKLDEEATKLYQMGQ